ncbi:MAG: ABC transporter ATP-binding protein [Christensenellales bacterium]|jgi:spermidine/putrescine transport system ATP-binding protein
MAEGRRVLLTLRGLYKAFDTQEALRGIDLDVYEGEFLTLLGPSGCGKTTTLRIIAGLEMPTEGSVLLSGEDITRLPPEKRQVNTVFQNYALFPHMNVEKNIAYGLRMRGASKQEMKEAVEKMLELVQLEGYGRRTPGQLSGGQRQRVAIARSLVLSPRILLLDEPLGALDLQLRRQMQQELKRMQRSLGITFIYITHDQEEALGMSDRIALMREGRFVQIGTPKELYEGPVTAFAASFIGETNLLRGRAAAARDDGVLMDVGGITLPCDTDLWVSPGDPLCLSIRAERLYMSPEPLKKACQLSGVLIENRYAGGERVCMIRLPDGQTLKARHPTEGEVPCRIGDTVYCWWHQASAVLVRDDLEETA